MTDEVILPLVITDAGRAALVNAQNTGSNNVTITEIALGTGLWSPTPTSTGLKNEIKRVSSFGGEAVAPDTIHVTIQDYTTDEYSLGEFGLYTDSGALFAIYSQPTRILEKDAAGIVLLAADIVLESPDAQSIAINGDGISLPPATPTIMGLMYDAPDDENVWGRYKAEWVKVWQTGDVKMFSGTRQNIEKGWALMDGKGTLSDGRRVPDIRDRFIVAAGSDYNSDATGGSSTSTTTAKGVHSHSVSVNSAGAHSHSIAVHGHTLSVAQMPSHTHTYRNPMTYGLSGHQYSDHSGWDQTSATGGSSSHNHSASSNSTGNHSHGASSNNTGDHSHNVSVIPPYYSLAFIIKL